MKDFFQKNVKRKAGIILVSIFLLNCPNGNSPKLIGALNLPTNLNYTSTAESNSATSVTEGIGNDTYTIVLTLEPTTNVTINIAFDTTQLRVNNSTTSPAQLTFTSANWSSPQTVTVEALYDNVTEGSHTQTITHSFTSSDSNYGGMIGSSVIVNITDTIPATVNGVFQSGNHILATASDTIALGTTVNPARAFVTCNAKLTSSTTNRAITCQLNGAGNQVIIESGGGTGAVVDWYVMEYASATSVQRGATTLAIGANTANVTIPTAISTSKTFVIAYTRSSDGGTASDENRTVMARLTSPTNLELTRHQTTVAATVEWQVVQFDSSNVRSGTVTITDTNPNATAALGGVVNLNSSFLFFNYKAASAIGGAETDYYVRGTYSDSSTLSFTRRGTNQSVDISWFAVEMGDGTTVQRGSTTITGIGGGTAGNLSVIANLPTPVTINKSMIVFSNDTQSSGAPDTTQDSGTYTSVFNSTTQIQFTRNNDENNAATIDWFVISFQ